MARTRQQQEAATKQARAVIAAKRAASRQWRKPELLTLLAAWRQVLRHPQVRHETSDEFEHRLYEQFRALSTSAAGTSSKIGNGRRSATSATMSIRDELAIAQTTQILKRTFRFISEYSQKHRGSSSGDSSCSIQQQQETIGHSWFQLTEEERQEQFMQGQRSRRMNSFMDIDEEVFQEMTAIMTKTMHQLKSKMSPSNSKSDVTNSDSEQPGDDKPWSSAELWSLLHAWRETLEDPGRPRVHSPEFVASLVQRFADICDGKSIHSETSARLKKVSLVSLFALIKQYNSRQSRADEDWFTLSSTRRVQKYRELGHKTENYSELDRGMFSMLTFILELEDNSNQTNDPQQRTLQQQQQLPVEEPQNESSNNSEDVIDLVWDGEDGLDDDFEDHANNSFEQDDDGAGNNSASLAVNWSVERTRDELEPKLDNNYSAQVDDTGIDGDDDVKEERIPGRKRLRLDPEMLVVVDILEKEAKRLSAMLCEAKEEREADREERGRLWQQLKQDQEARRREQAEWRCEKEQLLQELERLRKKQYGHR